MILHSEHIHLGRTLSCGQAFRWRRQIDDSWFGVARDKPLLVKQRGNALDLSADATDKAFWRHYFALDADYGEMEALLAADPQTAPALEYSRGIRLLRQDPYETLISFVISQNNNVKRIAGIVEKLCAAYGEPGTHQGIAYRCFPASGALAKASPDDLRALGTGYRAPYLVGCARAVEANGNLDDLRALSFEQAKKELMDFPGVGPKVAECVMLFSLGFDAAYPQDVWVKRISAWLYPGADGPAAARAAVARFGRWAGAAQQYLFHYARTTGLKTVEAAAEGEKA